MTYRDLHVSRTKRLCPGRPAQPAGPPGIWGEGHCTEGDPENLNIGKPWSEIRPANLVRFLATETAR